MKKILFILAVLFLATSCSNDLEDLNVNKKDPSAVPGESLFTGAQKNLFDQMVSTNVNENVFRLLAQQWAQTQYPDESQYDLVNRNIPENFWSALYRDVLKDLDEAVKIIAATEILETDDPIEKANKLQIIEIFSIYVYSVLVETFGDIPYEEALNIEILSPKYDDGETIYKALISRLSVAISALDTDHGSFGVEDNMYQGDVAQWYRFANSLKLRMGLLMGDVDNALAKSTVEEAAPYAFKSNEDNASINYFSSTPNTNPLYVDLVASERNDFVAANTLVDIMNGLNDPRRPLYFTLEEGVYTGGIYGKGNNYAAFSHIADPIKVPTFPGTIMDYAEVEFLLAEAIERGYSVSGTVEGHYNAAITASVEFWGGAAAMATTYLAQPEVAYATAEGDYKQKIGMQKWIALYNRGFTAWTEWRKFDYPVLLASEDAVTAADGKVPVRYTYPVKEQTLNGTNYQDASSAIGGDLMSTKLFWDKN